MNFQIINPKAKEKARARTMRDKPVQVIQIHIKVTVERTVA